MGTLPDISLHLSGFVFERCPGKFAHVSLSLFPFVCFLKSFWQGVSLCRILCRPV